MRSSVSRPLLRGWRVSAAGSALGSLAYAFGVPVLSQTSNVIFLVGSLLCATAPSSAVFILGRAVTGVGFAGEMAGCYALLVEIMPLRKRPVYAGMMAAVESLAIIAAPIVGGGLTKSLGWRWCFW